MYVGLAALAGLFDAFVRSSPRVASFIERDARINAILATQLGMPFGASQQSGSRAFQSKIPVFYEAFRNEFIWICRHTIAVEPGQQRIAPASIQQRVGRSPLARRRWDFGGIVPASTQGARSRPRS